MWQDLVITSVSLLFAAFLIPQLWDSINGITRTNKVTSITTGSGLLVMSGCYFTLDLVFSGFSSLLTALVWFALAVDYRQLPTDKSVGLHLR